MSGTLLSASDAALLISTRQRAVWTTDERKLLNRLAKVFNAHGDKLLLLCGNVTCPDQRLMLRQDGSAPGGMILQCGCTSRVFTTAC